MFSFSLPHNRKGEHDDHRHHSRTDDQRHGRGSGTIRIDPYYIAMMGGGGCPIEDFDGDTTHSMREHIEWLEGQQAFLVRWVAVIRQLDDGVLVAEPWIIEQVRENAVGLHDDSLAHNDRCGGSCNCADIAERSAALHALADRLEAASVPRGGGITTSEHDWERLREEMGEPNANRLRRAYELVGVPGLPDSAIDGLLEAEINPADTATMTDKELLRINGVGPAAVSRLHSYQEAGR